MLLGFIFAIIVSVLFAIYAVPRKFSSQNVLLYTMWMGVAYFVGTLLVIAVMWGFGFAEVEDMRSPWHWVTVARGLVWVFGMAAYNLAIDRIGLVRFNQWKNFQGPIGSLLLLFFLAEVVGIKALWLVLGMVVMFISAVLFTIKDDSDSKKKNTFQGVAFALFAAVCFGVSILLLKIVTDQGFVFAQLFYHSLSLIIFSAIAYLIMGDGTSSQNAGQREKRPIKERLHNLIKVDKKTWLPFMAGGMFLVATFLMILALGMIASPIVWSITQLNVVWTVLIGIIIFKEVDFKAYRVRITVGFLTAIVATVLLFFAR